MVDQFNRVQSRPQPETDAKEGRVARLPRILVTNDEPVMLDLVDRALGDDFLCEFAGTLEEVHEMLGRSSYDLVLCRLPDQGSTGSALAEKIVREHPQTAAIVLLSWQDDPEIARRAFDQGVYDYLLEPFPPEQLLITVMSSLRRKELEVKREEDKRKTDQQGQRVLDMVPLPIYAKDISGRYTISNAKAEEMVGLRHSLIGLTDEAILPLEHQELGAESDRRVFVGGITHEREDTIEIQGATKTFKTIRFPLRDENDEITAVGGVSIDITAENEAIRLRDELAASQRRAIEGLRFSNQEMIEALSKAIDLHDSTTGEHVIRMAAVVTFLGEKLGLDPERVQLLGAAAPMHDVGKIGIRSEILRKPGRLSDEERQEMKRHTLIGHQIFSGFESNLARLAATIALSHHERFDGHGYPHGLAGVDIPLAGRIAAVADVFDALLSERSYRRALPLRDALGVMGYGRGNQFDPAVVDALLDNLDELLSTWEAAEARGAKTRPAHAGEMPAA